MFNYKADTLDALQGKIFFTSTAPCFLIIQSFHIFSGIATYSRDGNMESFCVSVRQFSTSVCTLTESASQSAYLVGIADKASEPGKPGLVDQSQFSRANQAIQQACQTLASPTSSQSQVIKSVRNVRGFQRIYLIHEYNIDVCLYVVCKNCGCFFADRISLSLSLSVQDF